MTTPYTHGKNKSYPLINYSSKCRENTFTYFYGSMHDGGSLKYRWSFFLRFTHQVPSVMDGKEYQAGKFAFNLRSKIFW